MKCTKCGGFPYNISLEKLLYYGWTVNPDVCWRCNGSKKPWEDRICDNENCMEKGINEAVDGTWYCDKCYKILVESK